MRLQWSFVMSTKQTPRDSYSNIMPITTDERSLYINIPNDYDIDAYIGVS